MSLKPKKSISPKKTTPSRPLNQIQVYDTILAPIITEKTTFVSQHNQFVFRVPMSATKPRIKAALEACYKVRVVSVNTLIQKGKRKRVRGRNIVGRRADRKKAFVTLAQGERLDITTGI